MENLSTSLSALSVNGHSLDNMPEDIYHFYLFGLLDIRDLLELKLVSKKFYCMINDYDFNELSLLEYLGNKRYWFSTQRSTELRCQLDISKFNVIKNPTKNFLNLKYLRIEKGEFNSLPIRPDHLNKFTKLQILEIQRLDLSANDVLNLPELRVLSIELERNCYVREYTSLFLDTPNLQSLNIHQYRVSNLIGDVIGIKYPLSIRYLKLNNYDRNTIMLSNLECLELDSSSRLIFDDLLKFDQLKTLKFKSSPFFRSTLNMDELYWLFDSERSDLEIVLECVKMKDVYDELRPLPIFESLDYQLKNYDKLVDNLSFVTYMDYDKLVSLLPVRQPADLFSKYTNIQKIEIHNKIKDENRLINFIKNCPNLYQLMIYNSSVSQKFYDQLPEISSLTSLGASGNVDLNYEFIMKIPYLIDVYTEHAVLMTENLNLNHLKYFKEFRMQIRPNNRITIFKIGDDRYYVDNCRWLGRHGVDDFSFNDLIEWSQKLVENLKVKMEDKLREPHPKFRKPGF